MTYKRVTEQKKKKINKYHLRVELRTQRTF